MSLATRLNQLRINKNKSLQEVADAMRVSKTHIWELEKGRSDNPSLEMLTKLSNYFGVPIQQLVGEDLSSSDDKELIKMFRQVGALEQNDRDVLDDMIRGMTKRKRERESGN